MPRYFLDLPEDPSPRLWDPHAGPRPERADTRYFGRVFQEMERTLVDAAIDVHLTWDTERLPWNGDRVVAVVLGDEEGRIPRYTGRVRAVFKCYGISPALGSGPLRDRSPSGAADLFRYGLHWLRWLPGGAAHARMRVGRRLRGRPAAPPVADIPLGTFNQLELGMVAIEDRPTDMFFAGSVEHGRRRLPSPKALARREMLAAVDALAASRPGLRADIRLTPGFEASEAASPEVYSRALLDAKVCLAPRGASSETFRTLEGLRAGCVVVAQRLPQRWFYAGGPMLQLDRWGELERVLGPVLDDEVELRRRHARALAWWRQRCSEEAVGRFMAERLNRLTGSAERAEGALGDARDP